MNNIKPVTFAFFDHEAAIKTLKNWVVETRNEVDKSLVFWKIFCTIKGVGEKPDGKQGVKPVRKDHTFEIISPNENTDISMDDQPFKEIGAISKYAKQVLSYSFSLEVNIFDPFNRRVAHKVFTFKSEENSKEKSATKDESKVGDKTKSEKTLRPLHSDASGQ